MSLFLFDRAICPRCKQSFPLTCSQKMIHLVRLGNRKLIRCPLCKKIGLCKGQ